MALKYFLSIPFGAGNTVCNGVPLMDIIKLPSLLFSNVIFYVNASRYQETQR